MSKSALVIGSGPGGAAAAVRLKQRGVQKVTLVDKDVFPRDKTCGSALSPNSLKLIESRIRGMEASNKHMVWETLTHAGVGWAGLK